MLDAIAQSVQQVELDEALQRVADKRWERILSGGTTVPWHDAKTWLKARLRGV
jgi:hypothetical protein